MGRVLRQHRETTHEVQFLAKPPTRSRHARSSVLASAFDDDEPYALTELEGQFVHYVLNKVVPRLGP
jgi:hypothetical protein